MNKSDKDLPYSNIMRSAPIRLTIPELNIGNPAFKDWSNKLKKGERLPRGKYFAKVEISRQLIDFHTDNEFRATTIHCI